MNLACRLEAFSLHQGQHLTGLQLRDKSELQGFNIIHCLIHPGCVGALNTRGGKETALDENACYRKSRVMDFVLCLPQARSAFNYHSSADAWKLVNQGNSLLYLVPLPS